MLAAVLLAGCSGTPENFWRGLTRALCKYSEECAFVALDNSVGECVDRMFAEGLDPDAFDGMCEDYDSPSARTCLAYVRDARDGCSVIDPQPAACEGVCGPGTWVSFVEDRDHNGGLAPLLPRDDAASE